MKTEVARRYGVYKKIRLAAKILSVISAALLLFFVLSDFNPRDTANREIIGLMFFPFGVAAGFVIAWKWEIVGGLFSLVSLFFFYAFYGMVLDGASPQGFSFFIFTTPAVIFLISGLYGRIAIAEYADQRRGR